MAIERLPGYEGFVGRSEEAEHRAMLGSPSYAYRLGVDATGAIEAFAILRGLDDPQAASTSSAWSPRARAAASAYGFLSLLLDEAFGELKAHRFWLDCFADNARASAPREARLRPRGRSARGLQAAGRIAEGLGRDGAAQARVGARREVC